ncbi:MAG: polysaccharide deacetylase family protein [Candidatus Staskawiczbacteria bacterium]|nr:polysaccharide deacetylase family protein [Candidatus Staskawiczbacteria bacterium]
MGEIIRKFKKFGNKAFRYAITKICPFFYLKFFYKKNVGKMRWNGKKSCLSLSFDCDYTEDIMAIPLLLDILSRYPFKASFASVGKLIEKYPKQHRRIIEEGHEIINHTYTHPNNEELNPGQKFNELAASQRMEEIKKCDEVCKNILGYAPMGFRTPHFANLHGEDVYGILCNLGYKYSSSVSAIKTSSCGLPFMKNEIMEFPLSTCPKHPFAIFDTWHSLERGDGEHKKNGEFYKLFKKLMDIGIDSGSYINLYFDPQDIAGNEDFKLMLDYIAEKKEDIWVATYKDIFEKIYAGK